VSFLSKSKNIIRKVNQNPLPLLALVTVPP